MSNSYTGDVTLSHDQHSTPVKISGLEDLFIKSGAVAGNVKISDADYVFTGQQPSGSIDDSDFGQPETDISGSLEDGYLKEGAVDGDVIIEDVQDVFIEADAVSGDLLLVSPEDMFESNRSPSLSTPTVQTTGWRKTERKDDARSIDVTGAKHSVVVSELTDTVKIYVTGWENTVEIDGDPVDAELYILGRDNRIKVGPYIETEVLETGYDNQVEKRDVPVSDLINESKSDARPFFGPGKAIWQEPAEGTYEKCPSCKANSSAVIESHYEDAFYVVSSPVSTNDSGYTYECENCSSRFNPAASD